MNKEYAFDDYIFYLDEVTCAQMMRTLIADDAVQTDEEREALRLSRGEFNAAARAGTLPTDFTDIYVVQEMMAAEGMELRYITSFVGSCETIEEMKPLMTTAAVQRNFNDADVLFLPLDNESSLFEAAYDSPRELLEEVRRKLQKYLPDDFDFAAYLCRAKGTYCC